MSWANRKTFSRLTPIVGFGFLIVYGMGMLNGRPAPAAHVAGIAAGLFFVLCLAMTPLYIVRGIRGGQALKKPFGLFAFVFAVLHGLAYLAQSGYDWGGLIQKPFVLAGSVATLIMLPLALTSTPQAMRRMGKHWKRLQQLIYLAAVLVAVHLIPAGGPLMGLLILALLAVRIPLVRDAFIQRWNTSGPHELARL